MNSFTNREEETQRKRLVQRYDAGIIFILFSERINVAILSRHLYPDMFLSYISVSVCLIFHSTLFDPFGRQGD